MKFGRLRGGAYLGKPRPVLIVQDMRFSETNSVVVCGFTTDETDAPEFRVQIEPSELNGLHMPCRLMIDKVVAASRERLGQRLGVLSIQDQERVDEALLVFLGLSRISPA